MSTEIVVVIVDVGRSISGSGRAGSSASLEAALKAVSMLVQQKLLYGKKDRIGLVLFGTDETDNPLSSSGYKHIKVLRDVSLPDLDLIKLIEDITPGSADGDFIDALIVGMDMLINKAGTKKVQKRIFLVTDAGCPANKSDLSVVIDQFNKMEARLNVIGVDFDDEEAEDESPRAPTPGKTEIKASNEILLYEFARRVKGVVVPVEEAIQLMSVFRSQSVLQRTCFRGDLEVFNFGIPVWGYLKTKQMPFPRMSKVSVVSMQSANPASMGVKMERSYQSLQDPDMEVEERVKGYKYGKTLVPFSKFDEKVLKYSATKCLKVIGFCSRDSIQRHHYMTNVIVFVSPPNVTDDALALSSLVQALAETDSVAIARLVKRNGGNPYLVVLSPRIKVDHVEIIANQLPFAEDLRSFPFNPLIKPHAKKSLIPSEDQLSAMDNLIDQLDLSSMPNQDGDEEVEILKCKHTFNPAIQNFYQCLQFRAFHKDEQLPKLDTTISKYLNPDEQLFKKAENVLKKVKENFPISIPQENEDKGKKNRRFWKDAFDEVDVQLDSYVQQDEKKKKLTSKQSDFSLDKIVSSGTSKIGSVNPVQDFRDMLARRDVDLVSQAISEMKELVISLVTDSVGDQLYKKALNCIIALRSGCIQEEESSEFNNFLKELRKMFENRRRNEFWELLRREKLTLIDSQEADDSDISPHEAVQFIVRGKSEEESKSSEISSKDDVDQLFDEIE